MNQIKMPLATVLAILSASLFGFVCFLGANFYTEGNTRLSIITAVIITLLLSAFALGFKKLKQAKRNFNSFLIYEVIAFLLFTVIFLVCTWFIFSHSFVVFEKKSEIQNKLEASIAQAQNMFKAYEKYTNDRLSLYESTLKSVTANQETKPQQFAEYGFQAASIDNNTQINHKMFAARAKLFPTNYSDTLSNNGLKEIANKWLLEANDNVSRWKPIGVVNVTNEIEKNSQNWLNKLIGFSIVRQTQENALDFEYSLSFESVKNYFTTQAIPTPFSLVWASLTYLLMLLPWIVAERDTRGKGARQTKEYEIVL